MTDTDTGFNRPLLAAAGLLSLTAMAEMGVVNIALPSLAADLGVSIAAAQWVVLAYQLPLTVLLIPVGFLLDRRPMRLVVLIALGVFGLSGIAAWAAPTAHGLWWLIAVRGLQGAAGAILFVMMPMLAIRSAPAGRAPTALSVTATLGPLGAVLGPVLGGLAVDAAGWRAAFLVKIPFAIAAALLILRALPSAARAPAPPPGADTSDGSGGVLFRSAQRLRSITATRALHGLLLGTLGLAAAMQAMQFTVSYVFQTQGWQASRTALVLTAFALVMAATSVLAGRLAEARGPARVAITGATTVVVGLTALTAMLGRTDVLVVLLALIVVGVGMGLYGGPTQAWVMNSAPAGATATVAGTMQLARTAGFAIGPLVASLALTTSPHGTLALIGATAGAILAGACFTVTNRKQREARNA
ncbi:MFS transporter [Tsukamurella pseudospumae]|uniref:Major facilitator superfamily (MFS) profile domain-containing protein n=1 Tax=Tsukamurella pseudospumae TaxID=239498 RepID=A0A137ZLL6_9ACTN|nr:MFS transporter [Tsukamurella pseudospumae]KXO99027.1 hypothetical protein AXK61_19070 [Tsukamurella pseudospumae]